MFSQDFREFIELLNSNKVEYLIVGGYAVVAHGHPRYTGDLDVWIHSSAENSHRVLKVLKEFGFASIEITSEDLMKEYGVIQLGHPPFRIDILNSIDGVEFSECFKNKEIINIEGLLVNFIGYNDLLKNKQQSGRLRDLDDIERLRENE